MWELYHKENWVPKIWWFWIVVLKKTLESPLDFKEIKEVNPKGNQSWIFFGKADAEAETSILWPPDVKNGLIGKDPVLGKIVGRRRRGWQRMSWLVGITDLMDMSLRNSRSWWWTWNLACCSPWNHKELDITEWLNWTEDYQSSDIVD